MERQQKMPGVVVAPLLEWRAQRIHDPVQKLRYLRRATEPKRTPCPVARRRASFLRRNWHFHVAGLALLVLLLPSRLTVDAHGPARRPEPAVARPASYSPDSPPNVWQVEKGSNFEVYSNGLRIENEYTTANEPRSYLVFAREGGTEPAPGIRMVPAGIVYHTTESHQAPFEPGQTRKLKRIGQSLLDFVRQNRSYNFVIDRFGRVFRVVQESDAAYHAGKSVWADSRFFYLNLNHGFLGISFEAQSATVGEQNTVSPAQVYAARMLTEMLRSRYNIPATNCVTHAQVSVNPSNMCIGYHTDWNTNFPFAELGLSDNYAQPLPSLYAFGFGYDPSFLTGTGARYWKGLGLAESEVRHRATAQGMTPEQYRKGLQKRYHEMLRVLEKAGAPKEEKS
jgi:hypothetical protein